VSDRLAIPLPPELLDRLVDAVAARVLDRHALQANHAGWPSWMSVLTAARYLDVSEERIRKLVTRNEIPYSQQEAGCRIFFDRLALDEWMRAQTHHARNRR
jgi:excisionase family DNA binding protein